MQLNELLTDEDAVSPVIGVILMVAITVILAAVIGTFVLGLGEQVQSTTPSASFTFDFDETTGTTESGTLVQNTAADTTGVLDITHDGGDNIPRARMEIGDNDGNQVDPDDWPTDVNAGDTETVNVDDDDKIRVIWSSEGGGNSGTIGKWTGPEA